MADVFEVRMVEFAGSCFLTLSGELDVVSAPKLGEAVAQAGDATVVVDLADLTFCDSSGIRAILLAHRAVTESGRHFALRGANGPVRRVFEITGLTELFKE